MKGILLVFAGILVNSAWASDYCKQEAEEVLEVTKIYKNYSQLAKDVSIQRSIIHGMSGPGTAEATASIDMLELRGQIAFLHMGGAKGAQLYRDYYIQCVAREKEESELAARKAARDGARSMKR